MQLTSAFHGSRHRFHGKCNRSCYRHCTQFPSSPDRGTSLPTLSTIITATFAGSATIPAADVAKQWINSPAFRELPLPTCFHSLVISVVKVRLLGIHLGPRKHSRIWFWTPVRLRRLWEVFHARVRARRWPNLCRVMGKESSLWIEKTWRKRGGKDEQLAEVPFFDHAFRNGTPNLLAAKVNHDGCVV